MKKSQYSKDFKEFVISIYTKLRNEGVGHAHKLLASYFSVSYWTLANWIRKVPKNDFRAVIRRNRRVLLPSFYVTVDQVVFTASARPRPPAEAALSASPATGAANSTGRAKALVQKALMTVQPRDTIQDQRSASAAAASEAVRLQFMAPCDLKNTILIRKSHHSLVGKWCWPIQTAEGFTVVWFVYKIFTEQSLLRRELVAFQLLSARRTLTERFIVFPIAQSTWKGVQGSTTSAGLIFPFVAHLSRKQIYENMLNSLRFFWTVSKGIVVAVMEIHRAGCIHCDIKPDNILVQESGSVRVIDFSCSHQLHDLGSSAGTFGYRAPEVASRAAGFIRLNGREGYTGSFRWGPEQDVFSIGMTLASLICGQSLASELDSDLEYTGISHFANNLHSCLQANDSWQEFSNTHGAEASANVYSFLERLLRFGIRERLTLRQAQEICAANLS